MKKIVSILIVLIFASPICFAKGGGKKGHHKKIFQQLNLTKEQKQSLDNIRSEEGNGMKELKMKKRELKNTMDQAMIVDSTDSKLRSLHSEISSVQTQIKTKKFEKMLKIRKILSAEQRKTFFEMKAKMGKRKHKRQND